MKNHRPFTATVRHDAAAFARCDSLSPSLGDVTGSGGLPTTPITQENLKPETRLFFGPLTYVGGSLARIDTDGGYIADGRFHAVYPDFQGNIRAVACGGEIKQVNHYYPYGLPFAEGIKPDAQPYKYGAKELVTDANLNLYDFHARWQDPVVPGFSRLDQMLEKYYNISPYAYCAGNPIRFIDPTGMESINLNKNEPAFGALTQKLASNNSTVYVIAHGYSNGKYILWTDPDNNFKKHRISKVSNLVALLKNDKIISCKFKKEDDFTIVFYSCYLAKDSESFAYLFSKEYPNATVVASTDKIHIICRVINQKKYEVKDVYSNGEWVTLKNGEVQESLPEGIATNIGQKPEISQTSENKTKIKSKPESSDRESYFGEWLTHLRELIEAGVRCVFK